MLLKLRKEQPKVVRRNKMVPGVIYGKQIDPTSIQVDEKELLSSFRENGNTVTFNAKLGRKNHLVLIKDLQFDLMDSGKIIHFDLLKIDEDAVLTAAVPINIIGRDIVEGKKLIVNVASPTINAEYAADKGVASFDIDISHMDIGDSVFVKDIQTQEGITILDDPEQMVLTIREPNVVVLEEEVEAAEGEETSEEQQTE